MNYVNKWGREKGLALDPMPTPRPPFKVILYSNHMLNIIHIIMWSHTTETFDNHINHIITCSGGTMHANKPYHITTIYYNVLT